MNRHDALMRLFHGMLQMERGKEDPYPIPDGALQEYIKAHGESFTGEIDINNYRKFVCAVMLGYYDVKITEWK